MVIGIIGGGASGMAAALWASENPNVQVIILERQTRVGRKLLATGNGRCNLSNLGAVNGGFHGENPKFADNALSELPPKDTLAWFRSLGLVTVIEPSGRIYPYSDQANSVVDVLRFALDKPNIQVHTGFDVQRIKKQSDGFLVESNEQTVACDKVIVACGGLAGTKLGGSMSGYRLLAKLGHKATKLRPALVQIKTDWNGISALKGVRANCHAAIYVDGKLFSESTGEVQFTEYGLSGPVIFEISRDVCQNSGAWVCKLDLLPDFSITMLMNELQRRRLTKLLAEELLTGILHNRLGRVVTRNAGIRLSGMASDLSDQELSEVCRAVKSFDISLTETLGMDSAQVTAGGIMTSQFDPATMESRLVPGLYACGEVLDIDGDCGGYNLQWAWSSGRLAGLHAGKDSI